MIDVYPWCTLFGNFYFLLLGNLAICSPQAMKKTLMTSRPHALSSVSHDCMAYTSTAK